MCTKTKGRATADRLQDGVARTLLILDDGALFASTRFDLTPLDRWERAVVDAAGGWDTSAPMHRRALATWPERLMELLAVVCPDVIAVTTQPALAPRRAAVSVLVALPNRPAVKAPLPVADGGARALAYAVGQVVGGPYERVVIVTGQRGSDDLEVLRSEVSWRCSVAPIIANAGRLGLLSLDIEEVAAAVDPSSPQKRAQDALCALLASESVPNAQSAW